MAVELVVGCTIGYIIGTIRQKLYWIEKFISNRFARSLLLEQEESND